MNPTEPNCQPGAGSYDPAPILARLDPTLTAAENAARLGVTVAQLRSWRAGRRRPRARAVEAVCAALGVHPTALWPDYTPETKQERRTRLRRAATPVVEVPATIDLERLAATQPRPSWGADAACTGERYGLFYPPGKNPLEAAYADGKAICEERCPVRYDCLAAHLDTPDGCMGGTTPKERVAVAIALVDVRARVGAAA